MTSQRTLSTVSFREFGPDDYPRFVDIWNLNYPDHVGSVSEQRRFDENVDISKYLLRRFAALNQSNKILGFGQIRNVMDMYHPKKFMISIFVDPLYHRQGIGSMIYHRIDEELKTLHAILAWAFALEDLPKQQEFYVSRGFHEVSRDWESHLDVNSVDTSKFQSYGQKVSGQGITFTTLAEEQRRDPSLKGLYELWQSVVADMPREDVYTPISYEQWKALTFGTPRLLPEGYIIAKHGSEYVGLSFVFRNEKQPQKLSQDDTGVRRDYRGRGIAVAMKSKIIEFARKHGYDTIETWNGSTNTAMLAINAKLGFKRKTGWIRMEKILNPDVH